MKKMKTKKRKKIAAHDLTQLSKLVAEKYNESNIIFIDENLSFDEILGILKKEAKKELINNLNKNKSIL